MLWAHVLKVHSKVTSQRQIRITSIHFTNPLELQVAPTLLLLLLCHILLVVSPLLEMSLAFIRTKICSGHKIPVPCSIGLIIKKRLLIANVKGLIEIPEPSLRLLPRMKIQKIAWFHCFDVQVLESRISVDPGKNSLWTRRKPRWACDRFNRNLRVARC